MAEHGDSSAEATTGQRTGGAGRGTANDGLPGEGAPPRTPPRNSQSQRASELWKLLATDPEDGRPGGAGVSAAPGHDNPPDQGSRWAGEEMGELLAAEPSPAPGVAEAWNEPAAWAVDPIPSAAEGGVLAMFTTGARAKGAAPGSGQMSVGASQLRPMAVPPAGAFVPVPPSWASDASDVADSAEAAEQTDRDRLVDMLDNLPGPLPRVGADDVSVESVGALPVTVWLWGDDDIYPGRVAGLGAAPSAGAGGPSQTRRGRFGR